MPSLQEMFHGHDPRRESETRIFFRVIIRKNEEIYSKPLAPSISSMVYRWG
jgi:hypothetical protein